MQGNPAPFFTPVTDTISQAISTSTRGGFNARITAFGLAVFDRRHSSVVFCIAPEQVSRESEQLTVPARGALRLWPREEAKMQLPPSLPRLNGFLCVAGAASAPGAC